MKIFEIIEDEHGTWRIRSREDKWFLWFMWEDVKLVGFCGVPESTEIGKDILKKCCDMFNEEELGKRNQGIKHRYHGEKVYP